MPGASGVGNMNFLCDTKETEISHGYIRSGNEEGTDKHRQEEKKNLLVLLESAKRTTSGS